MSLNNHGCAIGSLCLRCSRRSYNASRQRGHHGGTDCCNNKAQVLTHKSYPLQRNGMNQFRLALVSDESRRWVSLVPGWCEDSMILGKYRSCREHSL